MKLEELNEDWTDHKAKRKVPDGTFKKSGRKIATTLLRIGGSPQKAMQMLNFYMNRGGSVPNKKELDKAKSIISNKTKDKKS